MRVALFASAVIESSCADAKFEEAVRQLPHEVCAVSVENWCERVCLLFEVREVERVRRRHETERMVAGEVACALRRANPTVVIEALHVLIVDDADWYCHPIESESRG